MASGRQRQVLTASGGGRWFPARADALKAMVSRFIEDAKPPAMTNRIVAAIAPHAGYAYSGPVAGYVFRALRDQPPERRPETVVVLGFTHREGFEGVALMDADALRTPLGEIPLDREASDELAKSSRRFRYLNRPHATEHSAENEIPFVQVAMPDAQLVVGLIGDHDPTTLSDVVKALKALAERKRIMVVASADMLHDADYDLVTKTDRATLLSVAGMDIDGVAAGWRGDRQTFCGILPVLAAMRFAETQGCRAGVVLHYRNSGDDHPESRGQWVVGYGAVVFAAGAEERRE